MNTPSEDEKCPCCHGTGDVRSRWSKDINFVDTDIWSCIGCSGSGKRSELMARLLAGLVVIGPDGIARLKMQADYSGHWQFVGGS